MSARREEQESHHLVGSYIGFGKGEAFGTALYVTGWNDLANRTYRRTLNVSLGIRRFGIARRMAAYRPRMRLGSISSFLAYAPPFATGLRTWSSEVSTLQCYVYH